MDKHELLECISGYLPYGVKCIMRGEVNDDETPIVSTINEISKERDARVWLGSMTEENYYSNLIEDVFPILRPLSDLTKPCLEGGKIPVVELANMLKPNLGWHMTGGGEHCISSGCDYFFYYDECWFNFTDSDGNKQSFNQLDCFKFIYKHHFDIHNLIGNGYAIDINTLNSSKVE